jgi:hypothetical protein
MLGSQILRLNMNSRDKLHSVRYMVGQAFPEVVAADLPVAARMFTTIAEFIGGEGSAGAGWPPRFADAVGRALGGFDETVGDGSVVEGAGGGDEQFAGVASAAAVAPALGAADDDELHGLDLAGDDGVDRPAVPVLGHAAPVAAVGP